MKLRVVHSTKYSYSEPVQLNVHLLKLIPQMRSYYAVQQKEIHVSPHPVGLVTRTDVENNLYYQTWFSGLTQELSIHLSYTLSLEPFNPFGFIIDAAFQRVGNRFVYEAVEKTMLAPYLLLPEGSIKMDAYMQRLLQRFPSVVDFLVALVEEIHAYWKYEVRHEVGVWEPGFTFEEKKGSCRDLAWMLVHLLRSCGLAARFVSGYAFNPELEEGHELHAWTEVYLPGAGWVGLDPSLGLLTDHHYIPLACSAFVALAAPVLGNYGGTADSYLETFVSLSVD